MNANNQQPSFETHWVNTKTIQEAIDHLDEAKNLMNVLWPNAKGHDRLRSELAEAFKSTTDAILAMKSARFLNIINREEE